MITLPLDVPADRLIAVYSVHVAEHSGPIWIGVALASQVWPLADTRKNAYVRQMIERDGKPLIMLHILCGDLSGAKNFAAELHSSMPSAAAALADTHLAIAGRRVRRGDGIEYPSAREAARANGIDHSNMSKHLNRKPGHNMAGGHYFQWIE